MAEKIIKSDINVDGTISGITAKFTSVGTGTYSALLAVTSDGTLTTSTDGAVTYAKIGSDLKSSATVTNTIDLSANAIGKITLSANTAFSFTNFQINKSYLLIITANGYTASWDSPSKHVEVEGNQTFTTSGVYYVGLLCIDATGGSEKLLTTIMKGV